MKTAILGGTGYTALELIRILLRHPHATVGAVTSREVGQRVSDSHPSLLGRCDRPFELFDASKLNASGVACVFCCLPHGASMAAIPALLANGIKVIDLSADYRLKSAKQYAEWYHLPHGDEQNLAHAVYGLPELYKEQIRNALLVANPGCYPQTAILGLAPLLAAHLIDTTGIIIDSKSGVSGAGRVPSMNTLYSECNESVSAYGLGTHRHTPEIEQVLSDVAKQKIEVLFTPHLMPMDRGIFSTIYTYPRKPLTDQELYDIFHQYYAKHPFVRVRRTLPATKDTSHTNYLDICAKAVRGRIIVLVAEDNLIRGASGVAVQNMNIMFGYEETAGLL